LVIPLLKHKLNHFTTLGLPVGVDFAFLVNLLPTIKGDYKAFESYVFEKIEDEDLIECPVTIFLGDADNAVDMDSMQKWNLFFKNKNITSVTFTGGTHFYFTQPELKQEFASQIVKACVL
jgi:surfactin synthase thioesterase subunit